MRLGERFDQALVMANDLHAGQTRKASGVPYISHLLGVAALVLEHGGTEDAAIAALLHDAAEDQGGRETLKAIQDAFGDQVAGLVEVLTDSFETPKPPWRTRKETYITAIGKAPEVARLISAADSIHNVRAFTRDYRRYGETLWQHFKGGREGVVWYYRTLAGLYLRKGPRPLGVELTEALDTFEAALAAQ